MTKIFKFNILCDIDWETKVDKALDSFSGIQRHFEIKNYGVDLNGIVLVFMCQPADLGLKQRKRFSKKDKILYLDIMLNHNEMLKTTDIAEKSKVLLSKINEELFSTLESYKFKNADLSKLKQDFNAFAKKKGLT